MSRPTSIRMLHTSLAHRAPSARDSISSLLASAAPRADSGIPANPSSPFESARQMLGNISSRVRTEVDDKRVQFRPKDSVPPHALSSSSLYPTPRPFARPPLLGPPRKVATKLDPFHLSGDSPLNHVLNPLFALAFVNQMGKIKGRAETGLTWKSQRKVGKLVRRARAMGIVSRWSNQPVPGGLADSNGLNRFGRY